MSASSLRSKARDIVRVGSQIERLPTFTAAATRRIEQRAAGDAPPYALMARAGEATARLALALAPHAGSVRVFAGPGNNGGDGLEAARCLREWGRAVTVELTGDAAALPADAARALARAREAGVPIDIGRGGASGRDRPGADGTPGLAIDALLGIGASRAPRDVIAEAIGRIAMLHAGGTPVLAVDVPSGLDADVGRPLGEACVVASHTLAMLTLKPGLFTAAGRDHAGEVWLAWLHDGDRAEAARPDEAGNPRAADAEVAAWLVGSAFFRDPMRLRRHALHKGSFGDVAVVGGAPGMTGAALLAARAAQAAGAGRVFVDLGSASDDRPPSLAVDVMHPELMLRSGWWRSGAAAESTVVCGCGGGDAVRESLPRLIALAPQLVLDADALNAIAADTGLQTVIAARRARGLPTVLTPHPLEAARLLGRTVDEVQADRLGAAHELAARLRAIVVLKGSGTVIAEPEEIAAIAATGNASLASAGTGDVLAGWIGGRWAASAAAGGGHPTGEASHALSIVVRAVVEHGLAAEPLRPGALRAGDLVEALHRLARGAPA
ncbi:MAG: NAD(P)H-hydrate dehydratase [Caldimonas sp.]